MRLARVAVAAVLALVLLIDIGYRYLAQFELVAAAGAADPGARDISASASFPLPYELMAHQSISRVVVSARNVNLGSRVAERPGCSPGGPSPHSPGSGRCSP